VSIATPSGPAAVRLSGPAYGPLLLLGHGAGGGPAILDARDLRAAAAAAHELGWRVGLVAQPWHVTGRRVAEAPPRLDAAWLAVVSALPTTTGLDATAAGQAAMATGKLVVGGRSAGARVACRTAEACGATAVLALAFPLLPPGRPDGSRVGELRAPTVPRLVVQGSRDGFGVPAKEPGVVVHVVEGADHRFAVRRRDGRTPADVEREIRETVRKWLAKR